MCVCAWRSCSEGRLNRSWWGPFKQWTSVRAYSYCKHIVGCRVWVCVSLNVGEPHPTQSLSHSPSQSVQTSLTHPPHSAFHHTWGALNNFLAAFFSLYLSSSRSPTHTYHTHTCQARYAVEDSLSIHMGSLDRVRTLSIHACSCKHVLYMLIHLATLHYTCADIQRLESVFGTGNSRQFIHKPCKLTLG